MGEGLVARAGDGLGDDDNEEGVPGPGTAPNVFCKIRHLLQELQHVKIVLRYNELEEVNNTKILTKSGLPWLSKQREAQFHQQEHL